MNTESPKFYLMEETEEGDENARKVIKTIYGTKNDEETEIITRYLRSTISKMTSKVPYSEAFCYGEKYRKASWLNVIHIVFHELTGINVIMLYSNTILANITKSAPFSARTGTIAIGAVNWISAMASIWIIKWFGRRPILIVGYFFIGVSHIAIGFLTIYKVNYGILAFMCCFIIGYQLSTGQIAWMYAAETCCDISLGVSLYTLWFTVFILLLVT